MKKQINTLIAPLAGLAVVAGLTSCGTSASTSRPLPGQAVVSAKPIERHRDRVGGGRIVEVNGHSASTSNAQLASGRNEIKVRFDWPQGGSEEVGLKFTARPDRRYHIKYDPFPPTCDQMRGTTDAGNAASAVFGTGAYMMEEGVRTFWHPLAAAPGAAVVGMSAAMGAGEMLYRVKESIREHQEAAHYVDLMVVSEDNSEGLVCVVRAWPGGATQTRLRRSGGGASRQPAAASGSDFHNRQQAGADGEDAHEGTSRH